MAAGSVISEIRLVNGSPGDPVLFIDYPGRNDAFLFDAGTLGSLPLKRLADLQAVFLTHFHIDHFCEFDRVIRANLEADKTLHIFGPAGAIARVHQRLKTYDFQYFPFMKIVFEVHEIHPDRIDTASLICEKRFPEPEIASKKWKGPMIFETGELKFEVAFADHTVPCLSYALVEKKGYHPEPSKLATGALRAGAWVGQALDLLRDDAPSDTILEIEGGRFSLEMLAAQYFTATRSTRVAFVTDTAWSKQSRPGLVKIAAKAQRLYCDSFYAGAEAKQAAKHRHMTAQGAAELAMLAKVDQLILIHFAQRYAGRYGALVDEARELFPRVSAEFPASH